MDRLKPPSAANEFLRQVIQQLRMRRLVALQSEVIRSTNQALAEVMLPQPVHDNPREQMTPAILGVHQPFGQRTSLEGGWESLPGYGRLVLLRFAPAR